MTVSNVILLTFVCEISRQYDRHFVHIKLS